MGLVVGWFHILYTCTLLTEADDKDNEIINITIMNYVFKARGSKVVAPLWIER